MSEKSYTERDDKTLFGDAEKLSYHDGVLEGSTVVDGEHQELRPPVQQTHHRTASEDMSFRSQVSQLHYNNNRVALDRSIANGVEILGQLQRENKERPVFYPSSELSHSLLNSKKAHLALIRKHSLQSVKGMQKQPEDDEDEQGADLKILKLNIKMDNAHVSNLDKSAVAQILDDKLSQVSKHLLALKDRIDDTSSKVFVTGDLNSGKSTFCNALLRRKVLPEDQQPCTTVFCEVIDSRDNNGVEEVHAVTIGSEYDIRDETTYRVFTLKDLEELVGECDKYSILKVYVTDQRNVQDSLLRNGVVDIALIDAPGLNLDSYQTTEVFSRQEEIDLVVFVLSAENQFTLSAKEFIAAAAAEKNLIFIVVNRFDSIKNKEKCISRVLEQVQQLSPETHKDAKDFVHFVSSDGIVAELPDDYDAGGDGDNHGEGSSNNRDNEPHPDFDRLEASLRNFVLKKRALSKLQPAKTYLTNLFDDIAELSAVNQRLYLNDRESLTAKLDELSPVYEENLVQSVKVNEKIESIIEETSHDVYSETRNKIMTTLNSMGEHPVVEYRGLLHLAEYVFETQEAITKNILNSVAESEDYARKQTSQAVYMINDLAKEALRDEFNTEKVFRDDFMFTRRKDTITRKIDGRVSIFDFIDPSLEGFLASLGINKKTTDQVVIWKNSMYSLGLYAVSRVISTGRVVHNVFQYGSFFSLKTLRYLAIPVTIGVGIVAVTYLISDIPNALPRKLALKVKHQVQELDYPHQNSERIAKECRKVLKYPAREVHSAFQMSLDKHVVNREKILGAIKDADVGSAFFGKLLKRAVDQRKMVVALDLEGIQG
jgi:mitofusin